MGFAFPYNAYAPTSPTEQPLVCFVSRHVAREFIFPESAVTLWLVGNLAILVRVPKAAMHEDKFSSRWEDDVGRSSQIAAMETKSIAEAMQ